MAIVKLNRTLAWQTAIIALLLAWPLILFGRPTYLMGDSLSYLKVGRISVEYIVGKLYPQVTPLGTPASPTSRTPNATAPASPGDDTKTSRSISYSVAAYLLRWPSDMLMALALAQVAAASLVVAITAASAGVRRGRTFVLIGGVAATATPLAVFAAFATPDIWAGILIGGVVLLTTRLDRLSIGVRSLLGAMIAYAVTAHLSIPPLAAGMMIVGAIVLLTGPRFGLPTARGAWLWLLMPPLVGVAITSTLGFVAFKDVSVTGKRHPTALARSVSDGPARWYLERECKTPHYAVCEVFGTKIPSTVDDLLFSKNSLTDLATPEQMNRIRAEESEIVIRAGLAYPGTEAYGLARSILRQLVRFDLGLTSFQNRVSHDATGAPQLVPVGSGPPAILHIVELLTDIILALSLGWAVWLFNRLENRERATLVLVTVGIVGNAVICVVFSGIAERYQARVVWLLPVFILSVVAARYGGSDQKSDSSNRADGQIG